MVQSVDMPLFYYNRYVFSACTPIHPIVCVCVWGSVIKVKGLCVYYYLPLSTFVGGLVIVVCYCVK